MRTSRGKVVIILKEIFIKTEYITLGQLLKYASVVQSGGETKAFLFDHEILHNNQLENRRGKKCYPGDIIQIKGIITIRVNLSNETKSNHTD